MYHGPEGYEDGRGENGDAEEPSLDPLFKPLALEDYACTGAVSSINRIVSAEARKLHIYDIALKLIHPDMYDIGGTYTEDSSLSDPKPELWFFFSTTATPGNNYLLNLFVCHRKTGNFSIGVSNSNELVHKKKTTDKCGLSVLNETLIWQMFRSSQLNENYHLHTYCFTNKDLKAIDNNLLVIPISIEMNSFHNLNHNVLRKIKLNHDFGEVLTKQEKTDFVLISASQKRYPVHKIFLAAHSPVLRELIKNKRLSEEPQSFIDIEDNDMELLLEFIYTGTIKDILNKDCVKLLQIADRFQLHYLFYLTQYALGEQIKVENAVEIASISEKYKLEKLQAIVFHFIKNNPKVLETEGWKNLEDVNLAKKLFQYIHAKRD